MRRRSFLGTVAAAGAAAAAPPPLIKPKRLQPGMTIGLVTPSTYVSDPDELRTAVRTIEHFGCKVKMGQFVKRKLGYLGGTIEERAADVNAMFADPGVDAVFAIRGGYGSAQILPALNYDLIAKHPKIFIGYSDITAMHLAIHQKTGLVTFHGPVPLSAFTEYTQKHYRKALFESGPLGALTNPAEANPLRPNHTLRTVVGGRASGPLTGGCLTLLATTMGTPYEVDTRGRIFFIEDVGEEPYAMDRMLTQMRLAGKLEQAAGIVFGECSRCTPKDYKPGFDNNLSLGEVVDEILGKLKIPVLAGLTIGHTADQLTLPMGVAATLDADAGTLTVTESATV
ncbi:MAG: LD-carboxypeptidase [Acidobacteriota bacterium]|jgi:muramoyltetrapeptide carboxypeptidase|nr:LD-carboxypeptidase [Bryobacteraceae bacterium CoA2 C42]MCA2964329.1 LD-carboxypeptidase [Acidobacteriaceae bacterium]